VAARVPSKSETTLWNLYMYFSMKVPLLRSVWFMFNDW
jgi:hypothetical protein